MALEFRFSVFIQGEYCPKMAPQQNYTEAMNVIVLSTEYAEFAADWTKKVKETSEEDMVNLLVNK